MIGGKTGSECGNREGRPPLFPEGMGAVMGGALILKNCDRDLDNIRFF
jgi:hypothetical protein